MVNRLLLFVYAFAACSIFCTGCASDREMMLQQGYPPAYADGYSDGCSSGKKAAGSMFDQFKKDVNRFQADSQYTQGWNDGFKVCEKQWENMQKQNDSALRQQELTEQKRHDKRMEKQEEQKALLKGIDTSGLEKLERK